MYSMSMHYSGHLEPRSNSREVQVRFECLSYAKIDFSLVLLLTLAAEHISLTLNVFNVNELIWVLETSINLCESARML